VHAWYKENVFNVANTKYIFIFDEMQTTHFIMHSVAVNVEEWTAFVGKSH